MGKRELVLIIVFVALGAVAYEVTAPAPKAGERGFSLARIFTNVRREMRANSASASITKSGTVAVRNGVNEVRLNSGRNLPITVTGEKRSDIAYELSVQSSGPDEATAREYANKTEVADDDLGAAQSLSISYPKEGQQTGKLTLRVPAHLLIRLEGSGRTLVSDVRSVDLRNFSGEATLTNVSGTVTGSHRAADLSVTSVGGVNLALANSRAKFMDIHGPVTINGRSGTCAVTGSHGMIDATVMQVDLTITDHEGAVKVTGENGTLRLAGTNGELSVDARRMQVDATLSAAVPATIITTDETLRLTLTGPPSVTIDALVNESGAVRAPDLVPTSTKTAEPKLSMPVGAGGPRLVLRNTRADIVIAVRK
jgi:hypothetical protein